MIILATEITCQAVLVTLFSYNLTYSYLLYRPLVGLVSGSVFQVLVMASICPEAVRTYDVGASSSNITITLPGTLPADAQRRKYVCVCATCVHAVSMCICACLSVRALQYASRLFSNFQC